MGNIQSNVEKTENTKFSLLKKIDIIAAHYITTLNMEELMSLSDKEKCEDIEIFTKKQFEKNFNFVDIQYIKQRQEKGLIKNYLDNSEVIVIPKNTDLKPRQLTKKNRLCEGVAKFYIKLSQVYSGIVKTLNPIYVSEVEDIDIFELYNMGINDLDDDGKVKKNMKKFDNLCDKRIRLLFQIVEKYNNELLKYNEDEEEKQKGGDQQQQPMIDENPMIVGNQSQKPLESPAPAPPMASSAPQPMASSAPVPPMASSAPQPMESPAPAPPMESSAPQPMESPAPAPPIESQAPAPPMASSPPAPPMASSAPQPMESSAPAPPIENQESYEEDLATELPNIEDDVEEEKIIIEENTDKPKLCKINEDMPSLFDEVGISELEDLFKDKYDFENSKYVMSDDSKIKYKELVKKFQETFSGKELNKSIVSGSFFKNITDSLGLTEKSKEFEAQRFKDIKLVDYNKEIDSCKYDIKFDYESDETKLLFIKYAEHIKKMLVNTRKYYRDLKDNLKKLFEFIENKNTGETYPIVNRDLTEIKLNSIADTTKVIITELYLQCNKDFTEGLEIYKKILYTQLLNRDLNRIANLNKEMENTINDSNEEDVENVDEVDKVDEDKIDENKEIIDENNDQPVSSEFDSSKTEPTSSLEASSFSIDTEPSENPQTPMEQPPMEQPPIEQPPIQPPIQSPMEQPPMQPPIQEPNQERQNNPQIQINYNPN
jgi:hypothetical protein